MLMLLLFLLLLLINYKTTTSYLLDMYDIEQHDYVSGENILNGSSGAGPVASLAS